MKCMLTLKPCVFTRTPRMVALQYLVRREDRSHPLRPSEWESTRLSSEETRRATCILYSMLMRHEVLRVCHMTAS